MMRITGILRMRIMVFEASQCTISAFRCRLFIKNTTMPFAYRLFSYFGELFP
jgi:hypothetical protein